MQLQVKKADGSTMIIDAVNSDTAAQLKQRIAIMDLASGQASQGVTVHSQSPSKSATAAAVAGLTDNPGDDAANMVLIFSGRQLDDTDTLEEHAVQKFSTLHCMYV